MSVRNAVAGVAVCLALGSAAGGDLGIVINEINYHAVHGAGFAPAELAWLELCNRDAQAVDLSGWSFARGIEFTFPAGTVLPGGGFLALCRNLAACAAVWPDVPWVGEFGLHLNISFDDDEIPDLTCGLGICENTVPACIEARPQSCDPKPSSITRVCNLAPARWASTSESARRMAKLTRKASPPENIS